MDSRIRPVAVYLALACACVPGCSNLVVKKVPIEDRMCGEDDQQGFRYYLNRPYLVVKRPILIAETRHLVKVDPNDASKMIHPDGSRRDRLEPPIGNQDGRPDTGAASSLTPEELARTGAALAETQDTSLSQPDVKAPAHTSALTGDMEIVYLPDLDEQYVIKSKNALAKSAFGLAFKDGSELTQVDGEHDSTTVTLALLDQVQNAIGQAQGVEQERIRRDARIAEEKDAGDEDAAKSAMDNLQRDADAGGNPVWQYIERTSIRPGVYRLNKPWELDGLAVDATGLGLLAKLGLPIVVDRDYVPVGVVKAQ